MTDRKFSGILVLGATGFVGRHLVARLAADGRAPRILVRDPRRAAAVAPHTDGIVVGDLRDPTCLGPALEGVRTIFYLVHSMDVPPGGDFAARDRTVAENVVRAADRASVARIVYVGGLGDESPVRSPHLDSRREVRQILERGRASLTTFRAAIIIGPGSASFEMIVQLVEHLPVLLCPTWIRVRCQPIAIADLVAYLVGSLDVPSTAGRSFDVGGPEVVPYYDLLGRVGRRLGRMSRVIVLPVLSPSLSAHWVGLITSVPSAMARTLVEGMRTEVVCRERTIRSLLPVTETGLDASIDAALVLRPLRPLRGRQILAHLVGPRSPARAVLDLTGSRPEDDALPT
ncbi:MAG TPA: NAD(P)H-binding protein [Thermoplasmata archaeon]|nr:NAD(P)H-binding protein [Thermoplasmata archaeon]